ncbi:hypothetical protein JW887_02425 [Candidatus Dojkabacteria bacterium]|nr:hypothetical protein [Candidatus Dojkabacteria bacterium]
MKYIISILVSIILLSTVLFFTLGNNPLTLTSKPEELSFTLPKGDNKTVVLQGLSFKAELTYSCKDNEEFIIKTDKNINLESSKSLKINKLAIQVFQNVSWYDIKTKSFSVYLNNTKYLAIPQRLNDNRIEVEFSFSTEEKDNQTNRIITSVVRSTDLLVFPIIILLVALINEKKETKTRKTK